MEAIEQLRTQEDKELEKQNAWQTEHLKVSQQLELARQEEIRGKLLDSQSVLACSSSTTGVALLLQSLASTVHSMGGQGVELAALLRQHGSACQEFITAASAQNGEPASGCNDGSALRALRHDDRIARH